MSTWVTTEEAMDVVITICLHELDDVIKELRITSYRETHQAIDAFSACGSVAALAPYFKKLEDTAWVQPFLTDLSTRCQKITVIALNDDQPVQLELNPIISSPKFKEYLQQYSWSWYIEHLFNQVVGITWGAYSSELVAPILSHLPVQNGIISVLGIDREISCQHTKTEISRQLTRLIDNIICQFHSLLKQQIIDQLYNRYDKQLISQEALQAS